MTRSLLAVGAAALVAVAGCGSPPSPPAASTAASTSSQEASAATTSVTAPAANAATVIPVTIAAGVVTPTNAEASAAVGQPIVLEVSSDATDSIHVHSVPEHVFDVAARAGQRFEFTVGVPGRVDVELHDLNRTVVTIAVRP